MKLADPHVGDSLSERPPDLAAGLAEHLAAELYGKSGTAGRLTSERDQNFRIECANGACFVLKISNPAEPVEVADFQVRALQHVAVVDPDMPVPRVVPSASGLPLVRAQVDDGKRTVRMLTYLEGIPLHTVLQDERHRRSQGAMLGRLGRSLRGFFHPAAGNKLPWDIKHASDLRGLIEYIPEPAKRKLAGFFLDNFERHAKPVLPSLRAQVVHNDLNAYNVLVDPRENWRVAGILDFGDMVHTALVNDVAVAASYHVHDSLYPLESVAAFVAAYHEVAPLERTEIELLYDLIAARFVTTVAITGWRAARYPENRAYILRNNPAAWFGLSAFADIDRATAQRLLKRACDME